MNKLYKIGASGILASLLASATLSVVAAGESGVFVGLEAGTAIATSTDRTSLSGTVDTGTAQVSGDARAYTSGANIGFDWGVRLGYQLYMTPVHGLRFYADYGMGHIYASKNVLSSGSDYTGAYADITAQRINFNIDYLLDFVQGENSSAGLYGGLFVGYSELGFTQRSESSGGGQSLRDTATQFYGGVGFGFNVGVQTTVAKHHRIELGAKIPVLGPNIVQYSGNEGYISTNLRYTSINMSYSFVF